MTSAAPCCFKAPVRREGQRIVTRFQLMDEMEDDLCSEVHTASQQMHSCFLHLPPMHALSGICSSSAQRGCNKLPAGLECVGRAPHFACQINF